MEERDNQSENEQKITTPSISTTGPVISLVDLQKYAWNYFELHAKQRMSLLNFFVLFATAITAGIVTTIPKEDTVLIGLLLSILLVVHSFVFRKLDERNCYLTKISEKALMELEILVQCNDKETIKPFQLFTYEDYQTKLIRKNQKHKAFWNRQISFSKALKTIFIIYGLIGVIGIIVCIKLLVTSFY